ncbi:adenylate/guanylate cyclase domain-containing protein [Spirochaetia bacterium]|nr:adenylate/guanylate cyclase domain-containing protein [Spirochaetia bacterium]
MTVQNDSQVRFPIGFKLVTVITVLLLVSLGGLTIMVSVMTGNDVRITAEQNNVEMNNRSAAEASALFNRVQYAAEAFLDTVDISISMDTAGIAENSMDLITEQLVRVFFRQNNEIAAFLYDGNFYMNGDFFTGKTLDTTEISVVLEKFASRTAAGETLENVSSEFDVPMALLYFYDAKGRNSGVLFSVDELSQAFGNSPNKSVMINSSGDVIVHYDPQLTQIPANMADASYIRGIMESPARSTQTLYTDENGIRFFAAFSKLPESASIIVTSIEYDKIFEGVVATTRQNIFLTGAVLLIAILCIWFFSKTISNPLKILTAASAQIADGNYELELETKNHDEIGLLTGSFVSMSRGLAERERLKTTFGRFTNQVIAEQAMSGEMSLGGETKNATVFFSDIRSFTSLAEKLEPVEVVEFLNDYMTRMVACVEQTGGVVDKFIGDAIMAVWGAPSTTGSPAQDALAAVQTALLMRSALIEFNKERLAEKKPRVRIGCGINTGSIVAGQIGSHSRMEYTVIGDAVNLASRAEELNKPLGTDILITENTWKLIQNEIDAEEMPPVTVKGKRNPVRLFAVTGLRVSEEGPLTLAKIRRLLGIPKPDLDKVDVDAKEEKYKLLSSGS